jgi:hypothetical protein
MYVVIHLLKAPFFDIFKIAIDASIIYLFIIES